MEYLLFVFRFLQSQENFICAKPHDILWCPFSPLLRGGAYPGNKATGNVKLTTHLHIVPRLRMSGVIPPFIHIYSCHSLGQLYLYFTFIFMTVLYWAFIFLYNYCVTLEQSQNYHSYCRKGSSAHVETQSSVTPIWSRRIPSTPHGRQRELDLVNDQLDAQFFYFVICSLQSSTCFEQRRAHHQEV